MLNIFFQKTMSLLNSAKDGLAVWLNKINKFKKMRLKHKIRYLSWYSDILIQKAYIFCLLLMLIASYCKLGVLIIGILLLCVCILFIIEGLSFLIKFKNNSYILYTKKIWTWAKYPITITIAILVAGDVNTFIYTELLENPKNYPSAIVSLTAIFTIIKEFYYLLAIFYILILIPAFRRNNYFVAMARVIALLFIGSALFIFTVYIEKTKKNIGQTVILHTSFYPNLECKNTGLPPSVLFSFTENKNDILVFDEVNKKFRKVPCTRVQSIDK